MAEGVDDETWAFHLRRKDYSRWFRQAIKDDDLADEIERIEAEDIDARGQPRHGPQNHQSTLYRASEA